MKAYVIILFCFYNLVVLSQTVNLIEVTTFPNSMSETSGLEIIDRNKIWTHNDSGNPPLLYEIDTNGTITRTIAITNATNIDWEELAQDDAGNFYIGDFGNNGNNRQNLRILKIPNPDLISDSIVAEIISFTYPDQAAFPPPANEQNFDMEAMLWHNDSLYLFSKNRTNPFDGYTKRYRLPTVEGTFDAVLIDSFYTGAGSSLSWWITAADISPDKRKMILLSHDKMWLFSCFEGADFFSGMVEQIGLGTFTQKEAVCFIDNDEVYITDEELFGSGGKLYHADISAFGSTISVDLGPDTTIHLGDTLRIDAGSGFVSYMWSNGSISQFIEVTEAGTFALTVTDNSGCIASDTINITNDCSIQHITINTGWNMISSYIRPDNPDVLYILDSIQGDIILIKNGSGQAAIPSLGINQIGNWNIEQGYKLKSVNPTVLTMGCLEVNPTSTPISISAGWNIISYLRKSAMNISDALNTISSDIILVKDNSGKSYIPNLGINTLGNMEPEQGYKIKMTDGAVLYYPSN